MDQEKHRHAQAEIGTWTEDEGAAMERVAEVNLAMGVCDDDRQEYSPLAPPELKRVANGVYTWTAPTFISHDDWVFLKNGVEHTPSSDRIETAELSRADALFQQLTELGQEYEAVMAENRRLRQRIRDMEPTAEPITNYRWGLLP